MPDVQIQAGGERVSLVIDGLELANTLQNATLYLEGGGEPPRLEVTLPPVTAEAAITGRVQVLLDPESRAALVAAGWTPPGASS